MGACCESDMAAPNPTNKPVNIADLTVQAKELQKKDREENGPGPAQTPVAIKQSEAINGE